MVLQKKSYVMDMTTGPVLRKIIFFSLPVLFSGVLQLLFNAIDMVVVGQYVGSNALAAVGSNGAVINLIINLLMGLSVGTNVMVARYYGSKDLTKLSDTIHTSILVSILGGCLLLFIGVFFSSNILIMMGTPEDVLPDATLYMKIYFLGMPLNALYNFGAAILRSIGDTRRPLVFLIIAGITNVLLNLLFVIVFNLGVAGVALATIISQAISAILISICLIRTSEVYGVSVKDLRIVPARFLEIAKIGLPAGIQGSLFSISNVLIQSSINSLGSVVMAGCAAAGNIEGFAYTSVNAFTQTSICFIGQNMGAKKYDRVKKIAKICILLAMGTGMLVGGIIALNAERFISIYVDVSEVETIAVGVSRLIIDCTPYFLLALMDVMAGVLRGMGYSLTPVLVSLTGVCLLRILWIATVFQAFPTIEALILSYPCTWFLTASAHLITFAIAVKKLNKQNLLQSQLKPQTL